jgi:acetyl-CoA C-acetyltransferase
METIACSPIMAGQLGIFDCSGVSDGSAAAVIVRAEDAPRYTDKPLYVKGLSFVAGPAAGAVDPEYDYTTFTEVVRSAEDAYQQAGVEDPRAELAMAEVHDCFTPTELVLYEDLGFAERGTGWKEALAGTFDLDGELPVNPDGGLKAFGHPIGASGLRMLFECWLQLRGEAPPERTIKSVAQGKKLALTHNLGGSPGECVSFVSVVGSEPSA